MQDAAERLAEAEACHDEDPTRAASLLSSIDAGAVPEGERALFAFLLNHVLGEKLGQWPLAAQGLNGLLAAAGTAAPPVLWRQAAVAATMDGDAASAARATAALARAVDLSVQQAAELVQLAAAGFAVPGCDAATAAATALQALQPLDAPHWQQPGALDAAAAACCNNLAAHLAERPIEQLQSLALRQATLRAALCSRQLWQSAGNWVHHERAHYGVAVAAGAAGEASAQLDAALQGLALLSLHDTAGEQGVDRAFLELEQAHALQRLARPGDAASARGRADALAASFGDASLTTWYRERLDRHRQLTPP